MKREIPALDGIRGLAIALVVWTHITNPLGLLAVFATYAGCGVEMFFALSGFLLFLPYARAFTGKPFPSAKRFYLQRARRILPMYFVVLFAIGLALARDHLLQPIAFLVTVLMLHDMYAPAWWHVITADPAIWSLAVEWQFYLLLPLIALGLRFLYRHLGVRGVIWGLLGLVVYGLGTRIAGAVAHYAWDQPSPVLPLIYGFKGKYLEVFAVGMLGAVFYTHLIERKQLRPAMQQFIGRWSFIIACLGFLLCFLWAAVSGRLFYVNQTWYWTPQPWWTLGGEWFFGVCSTLLIIGALIGPAQRVFEWMPLRRLGHISYSLFLIHIPVLGLFTPVLYILLPHIGQFAAYLALVLVVCGVSIPLAALTYRLIEQPFLGHGVPNIRVRYALRADVVPSDAYGD